MTFRSKTSHAYYETTFKERVGEPQEAMSGREQLAPSLSFNSA